MNDEVLPDRIPRGDGHHWETIISADNDVELLHYMIRMTGISDSARAAPHIAGLVEKYDQANYTQMTVTKWHLEVRISTPTMSWRDKRQQDFITAVQELYPDFLTEL